MGQKISDFKEPRHLFPEDLIPMVQRGGNVAITLDHFVHELQNILKHIPGSAFCIAKSAQLKSIIAEEKATKSLLSAQKALGTTQGIYDTMGTIQKEQDSIKNNISQVNINIDVLKDQINQLKSLLDTVKQELNITISTIEESLATKYIIKKGNIIIATITIPAIDTTLSLAGCAADAKTTGDAINTLTSTIENIQQSYLPLAGGTMTGDINSGTTVIKNNQVKADKFIVNNATDKDLLGGDGSLATPIDDTTILNLI